MTIVKWFTSKKTRIDRVYSDRSPVCKGYLN